jgi:hypothetical protein
VMQIIIGIFLFSFGIIEYVWNLFAVKTRHKDD